MYEKIISIVSLGLLDVTRTGAKTAEAWSNDYSARLAACSAVISANAFGAIRPSAARNVIFVNVFMVLVPLVFKSETDGERHG